MSHAVSLTAVRGWLSGLISEWLGSLQSGKQIKGTPVWISANINTETHIQQSGDETWRCLAPACNTSVKTNAGRDEGLYHDDRHSGLYPVTIRTVTHPSFLESKDDLVHRVKGLRPSQSTLVDRIQSDSWKKCLVSVTSIKL
ncbi:hypothetical protein J6590_040716 [Homalodisca vitripennis]|nr:hypothetical protein J6590_040716 [Homalodisca vitripennis]